jgi:hypothetical protein
MEIKIHEKTIASIARWLPRGCKDISKRWSSEGASTPSLRPRARLKQKMLGKCEEIPDIQRKNHGPWGLTRENIQAKPIGIFQTIGIYNDIYNKNIYRNVSSTTNRRVRPPREFSSSLTDTSRFVQERGM